MTYIIRNSFLETREKSLIHKASLMNALVLLSSYSSLELSSYKKLAGGQQWSAPLRTWLGLLPAY
jgi:hypothetical protein